MAIKSKELAQLLGVSTATMSLVLNHRSGISDDLRQSLLERVHTLGYGYMIKDPADMVRSGLEAGSPIKSIAYVVFTEDEESEDGSAFLPSVVEGAEREVRHLGYQFTMLHLNEFNEDAVRQTLNSNLYAGLLVYAELMSSELIQILDETEIPYVMLDNCDPDIRVSTVTANNRQGVRSALRYLHERGHTQIGYVSTGMQRSSWIERHRCFHEVMKDLSLMARPEFDVITGSAGAKAQGVLEKYWESHPDLPTAFLVENDVLALSVYRALRSRGKNVPSDVSVIGFEGRSICSMMEPTLTTVRVPRRVMGRTLATLLASKISVKERGMEDVPMKLELGVKLVEMESVTDAQTEGVTAPTGV